MGSRHPPADAAEADRALARLPWKRSRTRLLGGVPWGTLLLCSVLVSTYLFVQGGADTWARPLVIPFMSWSYRYPAGVLLGPVSHLGPDHLLTNLAGTLVFGSVAEYVFGHAGGDGPPADRPRTAALRAFVLFPAGALLVGWVASAFSWGPTIGFSNVVYAFAGVALVYYPVGTVVAAAAQEALVLLLRAVETPVLVVTRTPVSEPWFVDIAVQGHVFGLLLGVVVGVATLRDRDAGPPSPFRLWAGIALFAAIQSLWAIWWPRGTSYVLARGPGLLLVLCLATLVAWGAVVAVRGDGRRGRLGLVVLLVPLVVMAGIAVPVNTATPSSLPSDAATVDLRGYTITYVDDGRHERLLPFAAVTGDEPPTASGVVVADPSRGIWTVEASERRLSRERTVTLRLGGLGWARTVFVIRRAWRTSGGAVASQVWINPKDGRLHRVYASDPARASPVIGGYNVTVVPSGIPFRLRVTRDDDTVGTVAVPDRNETVTVGALELHRDGDRLVARTNGTRVPIARRR